MSDKKKKELSPEELEQAAGGAGQQATPEGRRAWARGSEGAGAGQEAEGELELGQMRGVTGGAGRPGTQAGGMTGREDAGDPNARTREEEGDGGTDPTRREPLPPV